MGNIAKILVADDDDDFREMLCEYLEGEGYSVIEAAGGLEAYNSAINENPDVLLLDVMMPNYGGFDVCRDLKSAGNKDCKCTVVMLTARASLGDKLTGFMSGASRYICKPCDLTDIGECLEIILRQRNNAYDRSEHI